MTPETIDAINKALKKGSTIEIKKENGNIVVVEIQRKVKIKTSFECSVIT